MGFSVADTLANWRARLEADGGGLENRYECKLIVGSNPTPSARLSWHDS